MTIIINIKDPVPKETDIIGLKESISYVLEQHDLNTGMIEIRDSDRNEELKDRYKILLKAYGEQSEYVSGFRACMEIIEREVCEMKPYEATEVAYKNGYKQGVKDFAERVKGRLALNTDIDNNEYLSVIEDIDQIAKEMGVEL